VLSIDNSVLPGRQVTPECVHELLLSVHMCVSMYVCG